MSTTADDQEETARPARNPPRTAALLEQLREEMRSRKETTKSLSRRLDRPYSSLRRYVVGERSLLVDDLLEILDALEVRPEEFLARVSERIGRPSSVSTSSAHPAASGSATLAEELGALASLFREGLLTDEEFARAKEKVLA